MDKEKFVEWIEKKVSELRLSPKNAVDTSEKEAFILGAIRTLELLKEEVVKGRFDITRSDMDGQGFDRMARS